MGKKCLSSRNWLWAQWVTEDLQIFIQELNTSTFSASGFCGLQGIDTEEKEKVDATKLFGANTPTVSCSFDSEYNKVNADRIRFVQY